MKKVKYMKDEMTKLGIVCIKVVVFLWKYIEIIIFYFFKFILYINISK